MSTFGKTVLAAAALALVLAGLGLGYALGRGATPRTAPAAAGERKVKHWTCSMHPQIRQPGPGQCPICAMDLVPVYEGGAEEEGGPRRLTMSEAAAKLAEIRTARVERRFFAAEVRMVGKIDYDETRARKVAARFGGRLEKLFVDFTGVRVNKDQPLFEIYSPELLAAQEELIQAGRAFEQAQRGSSEFMRGSSKAMLEAAREKLRLWGLSAGQVAAVEESGKARDRLTFRSPLAGTVVSKYLEEGAYVQTGAVIYHLVDLSRVWLLLAAYESDLVWLKVGQPVRFTVESYPGAAFEGKVAFIDPVLDGRTRTAGVRVEAGNADGRLKPGMFARAVVNAGPGGDGPSLVIPATAPLVTGTRAVVYVKIPETGRPTFEGREVVLGPRAGEHYVVRAGLAEGEEVVTRGAFKIDSALQIEAKPSMMSPAEEKPPATHTRGKSQTHCPVMGGEIDRKHYADYQGKRIYFCCPGCDAEFRKDPEKYLKKMREAGVEPESVPRSGGRDHGH